MKISELIDILDETKNYYGDSHVYFLAGDALHYITFLGSGAADFGNVFWLSADSELKKEGPSDDPEHFRAPAYPPDLTLVK